MPFSFHAHIFIPLVYLNLVSACIDGECRQLAFPSFFFFAAKRLVSHNITTVRVRDMDACELLCYQEPNCVSVNFENKASLEGTYRCKLNNATHRGHDSEFMDTENYFYHGAEISTSAQQESMNAVLMPTALTPWDLTSASANKVILEMDTSVKILIECKERTHNCGSDAECINTEGSFNCTVPEPVVMFPLNAEFGTNEINNRTAPGVPSKVTLAPGHNGEAKGSYEFSGTSNSYIEFSNSDGGALDVRYSMTMLCWLYSDELDGPIFNYNTAGTNWGVHLWVNQKKLFVRYTDRKYSEVHKGLFSQSILPRRWKFVGASYDHSTGKAKLWVDGIVDASFNIGTGLALATQDSVRMGVKNGDKRYFKGRIAQMQVYNLTLTQEQVQTIKRRTPEECQNYQSITTANRKVTYGAGSQCDRGIRTGWFRFEGSAGTRMATACTPKNRCNTHATGWLKGGHPKVSDGQVHKQVCFHWQESCCRWSVYIKVRNCGSYHVYYLIRTSACNLRYCSTD